MQTNRIPSNEEIIARALIEEIRQSSQDVIEEITKGITVNNIDEVTTSLYNEGQKTNKTLLSALEKLQKSSEAQSKLLGEISRETSKDIKESLKENKVEEVTVKNLSEITLPETISISNLKDLTEQFNSIKQAIESLVLPTPQITVTQPEIRVDVPSTVLNAPETDLSLVEGLLSEGLKKLKYNNKSNPIFVRLTDEKILEKLDAIVKASKETMLGFPGSMRIQNATGGSVDFNQIGFAVPTGVGSGKKIVTTAGTRVALAASQAIKSVTIKALVANTGTIYVGDLTVSSANGFQLSANDSVSMELSNLITINLDSSVNGEGVTYMWVN